MLVSDMMIVEGSDEPPRAISSNFFTYFLILEEQGWKEKQSENRSIRQFPSLNSSLKKEKEEKISLYLSSISISGDFKWIFCLAVRLLMDAL